MKLCKKVLVTRPAGQGVKLSGLLANGGYYPVDFPVMEIHPSLLSERENSFICKLSEFHYIFFVSVNAVEFAIKLLGSSRIFNETNCVAVGRATFNSMIQHGITQPLVPVNDFSSEGILGLPELAELHGNSCLIIRGEGGRDFLSDNLLQRGGLVEYIELYKRILPEYSEDYIQEVLLDKSLGSILIYSAGALTNLVQIALNAKIKTNLLAIQLVVISQRVFELAKKIGFVNVVVAEEASDMAMLNALNNGGVCG